MNTIDLKPEELPDLSIEKLGPSTIPYPVRRGTPHFIEDDEKVLVYSNLKSSEDSGLTGNERLSMPAFEKAGPRAKIFFAPETVRAGIVTCGGLCPGINDVIKSLVNTLYYAYGVDNIYGIQYGFRGLVPRYGLKPIKLDPETVDTIHENGGSVLGSSRGPQDVKTMVQTLDRLSINILFTIGGDGTQRGARDIALAAREKGLPLSVVGVPKTIDNDISFMERTFGYESAVYAAAPIISAAHDEAKGAYNGVGLVKLMGRESGFITAAACLANSVVNFCLIPEVKFQLEGKNGLLKGVERRLQEKNHLVIAAAEGAGQHLIPYNKQQRDASGNIKFADIGIFLKQKIGEHLENKGIEHAVKYFDPSYSIRSIPARGTDAIFALQLASNAVHAAMAGKTNMVVGLWQGQFVHIPIPLAVQERRQVNPKGQLWESVLEVTQQRRYMPE